MVDIFSNILNNKNQWKRDGVSNCFFANANTVFFRYDEGDYMPLPNYPTDGYPDFDVLINDFNNGFNKLEKMLQEGNSNKNRVQHSERCLLSIIGRAIEDPTILENWLRPNQDSVYDSLALVNRARVHAQLGTSNAIDATIRGLRGLLHIHIPRQMPNDWVDKGIRFAELTAAVGGTFGGLYSAYSMLRGGVAFFSGCGAALHNAAPCVDGGMVAAEPFFAPIADGAQLFAVGTVLQRATGAVGRRRNREG